MPSTKRKKAESGLWQKTLFVNYYVQLCLTGAFQTALKQFAGGATPLRPVLEETLLVKTAFHRMLVAREYSFLLANVPDNAGELVVSVGGGAAVVCKSGGCRRCVSGGGLVEVEKCGWCALVADV